MATIPNNRSDLIAQLVDGKAVASVPSWNEPDHQHHEPAEDFVLAWLMCWRRIGNDVMADPNSGGACYYITEDLPAEARKAAGLPNPDHHRGASRAMLDVLKAVPGATTALRRAVGQP